MFYKLHVIHFLVHTDCTTNKFKNVSKGYTIEVSWLHLQESSLFKIDYKPNKNVVKGKMLLLVLSKDNLRY